MNYTAWEHILAIVIIAGGVIVFVIDFGSEVGWPYTLRFRWTIGYYLVRYVSIVCAILLALDVLAN